MSQTPDPQKKVSLTKRKLQARETKERIYQAANQLFNQKSYDDVLLSEIAESAGISIGLFYHYFKNKEELMRLWSLERDDQYQDYFDTVICGPELQNQSPLAKIRAYILGVCHLFCCNGPAISRAAYAFMIRDQELNRLNTQADRPYYRLLGQLIDEARAAGLLRPEISRESIIRTLTVLSRGSMVDWILHDGQDDLETMVDEIVSHYLTSITVE